ncbi:MAG: Uma2 family endonuclease [Gemmatimonadales bacterium]
MPMARKYTVADLTEMPEDGNRYELIRGELVVSPAPSVGHQIIVTRLAFELAVYLKPLGLADTLFPLAADISWDDSSLVQPDLLVLHPDDLSASWATARRLRLAVEVLSPSSRRRDRLDKRTLYQENAVETYWAVDVEARLVERWLPADERPELLGTSLEGRVTPEAPLLSVNLPALFANLPG